MGNIVSVGVKVPSSSLSIITVPDCFEIMQNIALAQGPHPGDEIDHFTGKQVSLATTKEKSPISQIAQIPQNEQKKRKYTSHSFAKFFCQ
jgi:hypothetical protein